MVLSNSSGNVLLLGGLGAAAGMETLPLRMDKHCANALAVATFLEGHQKAPRRGLPGKTPGLVIVATGFADLQVKAET